MIFKLLSLLAACLFFMPLAGTPFDATESLPVIYQGRIRSLSSASKLWLYELYHSEQLKTHDLTAFQTEDRSALGLLWRYHLFGHRPLDKAPLFWIHYASTKEQLNLNPLQDRFSFDQLSKIDPMKLREGGKEAQQLLQSLNAFSLENGAQPLVEEQLQVALKDLKERKLPPKEIARILEREFPLSERLQMAGSSLIMLPSRLSEGAWLSLHALNVPAYDPATDQIILAKNFTLYSDETFEKIRKAYFLMQSNLEAGIASLAHELLEGYFSIKEMPFMIASEKSLSYPSLWQLKAETLYYKLPLVEAAIFLYGLSIACFFIPRRRLHLAAAIVLMFAFALNTLILAVRCFILQRPPVSNMFETVVYVPWIAMAIGAIFYGFTQRKLFLIAAATASLALLALIKLTNVNSSMENVQAVLDSQYWLIVHVLMVVGSYGAFALSGVLGHSFLLTYARYQQESPSTQQIAAAILHTMYVGVALLIPGTILGGVWAAESWGRFWDWDPKESWAFISACVYLLVIHAYTFGRIKDFGLAMGAIAGLISISFTWYGVNYILGTGLHSYGFGNGGEKYYFAYLAAEAFFLCTMLFLYYSSKIKQKTP